MTRGAHPVDETKGASPMQSFELRARPESSKDSPDVGADGRLGEVQLGLYLMDAHAAVEQPEDLQLADLRWSGVFARTRAVQRARLSARIRSSGP